MDILISTEKLSLSPEMLRELATCRKSSEAAVYACQQKIIDDAEKFHHFHRKRHEKALRRSIQWGAEYDVYLQKYLVAGLKLKTARTAARRDFIAAHPRPKNADDLIRTDEFPGLSAPSLRYYHRAYQTSLQSTPAE
ncbi:hypothetical protein [Victivallis vadensis]|uniref:hypothetical protein n=1 Tax=Victivallis vadensis TaxID=172901 RepID=UPI001057735F|nr:hypothetical protein [Victivallis vadensis]